MGVAVLFILGFITMFYVSNTMVRTIIYDQLLENSRQKSYNYSHRIDSWFGIAKDRVQLLSELFLIIGSSQYFEEIATVLTEDEDNGLDNTILAFGDGRILTGSNWQPSDEIDWVTTERPWFVHAETAGPGVIVTVPPYFSYGSGNISVAISTYLEDFEGVGAIIGTPINLNYIRDMLKQYNLAESGDLLLIGGQGEVIIHPEKPPLDEEGHFFQVGDIPFGEIYSLAIRSNGDVIELHDHPLGHSYLITTPIESVGWFLISVIPTSVVHNQVNYYTAMTIGVMSLILIVLFIVVSTFINRVATGLEEKKSLEAKFRAMIKGSPMAIGLKDANLNFIEINEMGYSLFGASKGGGGVTSALDVSPEFQPNGNRSKDWIKKYAEEALKNGKTSFEWMHQSLTGEQIPTEVTLTRTEIEGKSFILCYLRDLRAEKEMVSRLKEASDKSKAANEAKSAFLANMSHEIRTPMNAIIGMTDIGMRTRDDKGKNYAFERIEKASKHLLGIMNDVLDMSKIEAGRLELDADLFEFELMVRQAVDFVENDAMVKRQKLSVRIDPQIPKYIFSDMQKLTQVLTNLLCNATKFTPEEGLIRVKAECLEKKDGLYTLQIQVCDTGIGIDSASSCRIFEFFEREENHLSRKVGGTGLGLAISKRMIDLVGGEMSLNSKLGEGSVFSIKITVPGQSDLDPLTRKGQRVLLLGDDLDLLHYLERVLNFFQARCTIVQNLDSLGTEVFDLCFVDVGWGSSWVRAASLTQNIAHVVAIMEPCHCLEGVLDHELKNRITTIEKPFYISNVKGCLQREVQHQAVPGLVAEKEPDRFEGNRVLLVEDVEINREIVAALLEETGIQLEFAENGKLALEAFSKDPASYDLIFMDLHLPVMDGLSATKAIRDLQDRHARDIPIVAMTADVFQDTINACETAGMNGHISKPLNQQVILEKLRIHLK